MIMLKPYCAGVRHVNIHAFKPKYHSPTIQWNMKARRISDVIECENNLLNGKTTYLHPHMVPRCASFLSKKLIKIRGTALTTSPEFVAIGDT